MTTEMIQYLVIGAVVGLLVGLILSNILNPKLRKYRKIKKELDDTKQELVNQKQVIAKHFSHSAELLDNMARDFRRLYQHMAENSSQLLSDAELKEPTYDGIEIAETHKLEEPALEEAPKDYSGNPSGLLKPDTEHKS
ncbi:YhcB family protein [Zophobihabitans entericus]|uniref:Z-ring associated protein G n=1 Tax=Zophobihabitans entericus TaxID=1635327 RepID=A0A6G9I828_9GAMM|nr:DUF1043 family protein [Zophobihabitans entericus]QIQ20363.1 YhcB family protein [Zophobihabitans entericus]